MLSHMKVFSSFLKLKIFYSMHVCEELTPWKRLWCWEGLGAGGEGDNRGWDGWMTSPTRWMWVWVNSGSWWWTGRPGVLRFMGSQRVGHNWATELNWTECMYMFHIYISIYLSIYTVFFIHVSVDRHLKWNYHMIQKSHFQAFIWKNWN